MIYPKRKYKGGNAISGADIASTSSNIALVGTSLIDSIEGSKISGVKTGADAAGTGYLKGTASGAALGTSILPGWGTLIGAAIGGTYGVISGIVNNNKLKRQVKQDRIFTDSKKAGVINEQSNTFNNLLNQQVNRYSSYAKSGGKLYPKYCDGGIINGKKICGCGCKLPYNDKMKSGGGITDDPIISKPILSHITKTTTAIQPRDTRLVGKYNPTFKTKTTNVYKDQLAPIPVQIPQYQDINNEAFYRIDDKGNRIYDSTNYLKYDNNGKALRMSLQKNKVQSPVVGRVLISTFKKGGNLKKCIKSNAWKKDLTQKLPMDRGMEPEFYYEAGGAIILGGLRHKDGGNDVINSDGEKIAETEVKELLLTKDQSTTIQNFRTEFYLSKDNNILEELGKYMTNIIKHNTTDNSNVYAI